MVMPMVSEAVGVILMLLVLCKLWGNVHPVSGGMSLFVESFHPEAAECGAHTTSCYSPNSHLHDIHTLTLNG